MYAKKSSLDVHQRYCESRRMEPSVNPEFAKLGHIQAWNLANDRKKTNNSIYGMSTTWHACMDKNKMPHMVVPHYPWFCFCSFSYTWSTAVWKYKIKQFISFKMYVILNIVMKSLTILLCLFWDMNHSFFQCAHTVYATLPLVSVFIRSIICYQNAFVRWPLLDFVMAPDPRVVMLTIWICQREVVCAYLSENVKLYYRYV